MAILVCCSCISFAQESISKQRRALNAALTTIEDYSLWCTVDNLEAYYEFLDLFSSPTSQHYNDLLGIHKGKYLTPEEYAKTMQHGLHNKKVFVRNVKNEGITTENGKMQIKLSFDKAISYVDTCGTYFSSSEFFEADHHLQMILVYDEDSKKCKIEGITGQINSEKRFPEQYLIFASEDDRDVDLSYRNQPLSLNSYHQAFIEGAPSTITKNYFSYPDQNVGLKLLLDKSCNHISMKYQVRRIRLKPHYDLGLGNAYTIEGLGSIKNEKNSSSSFGIDFGYLLSSKRHFSLGLFTGFNISNSRLDLAYHHEDYSYQTNADIDGDTYVRHYQNLNLSQTIRLQDISIPFYLDMDFSFGKIVSLFMDLGIRANLNMTHKVDETKGSAYVYGIYNDSKYGGNLLLNENWPYNGFGNHQVVESELDHADIIDLKGTNFDLMGNAGIRFNIPNMPLSLDLGISYLMGLGEVIKTATPVEQYSEKKHPVIYNTISGENSVEHIRNLTEAVQSVKRRSLRFSLGLIWKF